MTYPEFNLTIFNLSNAAFGDDDHERALEIARILTDAAEAVRDGHGFNGPIKLFDGNGNTVGSFAFDYSKKLRA